MGYNYEILTLHLFILGYIYCIIFNRYADEMCYRGYITISLVGLFWMLIASYTES